MGRSSFYVAFGMIIMCRWEVWLQVVKRKGIRAGCRFHVVFGMVIVCRWEVWLQVAKRIGIGRSSILTRIWDWREANRLQSIRLLPQTQDAGSRLDLSNPLGFVIVFTLALTTPNHGLFLRAVSINMEAAGLEGNQQWGISLPSRWLNAKEYG